MKIIYSPYYGSRPYVNYADRGGVLFGEKAVGAAGLLDELALRTGLSQQEAHIIVGNTQRLAVGS